MAADPQTFSGPRFPPLPSAIPLDSLKEKPIFVTNVPNNKYKATASQAVQPMQPRSIVPKNLAWSQLALVKNERLWANNIIMKLIKKAKNQSDWKKKSNGI